MITQDHIEQELARLERCERFNDPTRRNWSWKEVWQEAIARHRAFLNGEPAPLKELEQDSKDNLKMNIVTTQCLKKGFK